MPREGDTVVGSSDAERGTATPAVPHAASNMNIHEKIDGMTPMSK